MLQSMGSRHGTASTCTQANKLFSHAGMPFLVHCLGENTPKHQKKKKPTPFHVFLSKHFAWLPVTVTFGFIPSSGVHSVRLLKSALPEEKIPFEMDRREGMEDNVSVDVVLLTVAKSDLRNFSVVLRQIYFQSVSFKICKLLIALCPF